MTPPSSPGEHGQPGPLRSWSIRDARADDAVFLAEMLALAADWRPGTPVRATADVLAQPAIAHYIDGWPQHGDVGVVAEEDRPVGAAWYRFLCASAPGYGYIDDEIPELVVGIAAPHRGRGLGRNLITALFDRAEAAGVARISLSVEDDNPAKHLYVELGFAPVGRSGKSVTMIRTVRRQPTPGNGSAAITPQ